MPPRAHDNVIKPVAIDIASGCEGPGPGIAIAMKNGQYDYEGLTACANRLKKASPDFADETQVSITANPGTEYQTLISAIDALRSTPEGEALFTDVNFKVPR